MQWPFLSQGEQGCQGVVGLGHGASCPLLATTLEYAVAAVPPTATQTSLLLPGSRMSFAAPENLVVTVLPTRVGASHVGSLAVNTVQTKWLLEVGQGQWGVRWGGAGRGMCTKMLLQGRQSVAQHKRKRKAM